MPPSKYPPGSHIGIFSFQTLTVIQRQQHEITDLRMRSMRDNILIKTSGPKYKETHEEDTANTVQKVLNDEMRIADSANISINSSNLMGQAGAGYNRMLIMRLPQRDDQNKIFDNASVLKGTDYSITKQVLVEIEEWRQFTWSEFKQAKADKRPHLGRGWWTRREVQTCRPSRHQQNVAGCCTPRHTLGY